MGLTLLRARGSVRRSGKRSEAPRRDDPSGEGARHCRPLNAGQSRCAFRSRLPRSVLFRALRAESQPLPGPHCGLLCPPSSPRHSPTFQSSDSVCCSLREIRSPVRLLPRGPPQLWMTQAQPAVTSAPTPQLVTYSNAIATAHRDHSRCYSLQIPALFAQHSPPSTHTVRQGSPRQSTSPPPPTSDAAGTIIHFLASSCLPGRSETHTPG